MISVNGMRARLREATTAAHERLHRHPGFAAAAAGEIAIADYRLLLARLYGFHRAFEITQAAVRDPAKDAEGRTRAWLIVEDLETLGVEREEIDRLPLCEALAPLDSEAETLGALYVLEGSTLGGIQIARALEPVLREYEGRGRRFYHGYGDRHGAMWRAFLARLEPLAARPSEAEAAVRSAIRTFESFELWMRGWRSAFPALEKASRNRRHNAPKNLAIET